jgi:hypothetical protein
LIKLWVFDVVLWNITVKDMFLLGCAILISSGNIFEQNTTMNLVYAS